MRVIAFRTLRVFFEKQKYSDSEIPLRTWYHDVKRVEWKNSNDLQETFKYIPLEKILIETDSPYLAPVPNRGKENEPSFVKYTAEKLADLKNISKFDFILILT